MPAECQIGGCGVLAVGRCHACSQAFCATHQAREGQTRFVDFCSACQTQGREAETRAAEEKRRRFLDMISARESRPFPRLVAGAVLASTSYPAQAVPWELYDPRFVYAPRLDSGLCERLARDFIEEAQLRGVQPERQVRARQTESRGRFYRRTLWKDIYSDGWLLRSGSSWTRGGKSDGFLDAIVWIDGAVTVPFHDNCAADFGKGRCSRWQRCSASTRHRSLIDEAPKSQARRIANASLGRMPTTSLRLPISRLIRSSGLVERSLG